MTDAGVEPLGETCGRTSTGSLAGVKARDQEAWRRFVELYGPLVDRWCRRFGLQGADVEDVRQDVFRTVAETVDGFRHAYPLTSAIVPVSMKAAVLRFRTAEHPRKSEDRCAG
jgi:DNA-directed RNA polymerase specialized sigma24 family protein